MSLSVAIVCRNNAATIGRTVASVQGLAEEIVAVDSGSEDGTIELLEQAGATVIRTEWKGHVATKQMALEACTHPFVLSLDSDESVEPELAEAIRAALARTDDRVIGWRMNRKVFYRGRFLDHAWQPEWRLRLVKRDRAHWTGLDPHDRLEVDGAVATLDGTLRHDSFESFTDHFAAQLAHARVAARSLHASGRRGRVRNLFMSPPGAFLKQVVLKQAWRDGVAGWLAASTTAAGTLMKHVALLEEEGRQKRE